MKRPLKLAIVNDYDVVVAGLAEMLSPHSDRVAVVETLVRDRDPGPVDVTLYDTFTSTQVDASDIDQLIGHASCGAVAVYTWNMHRPLVQRAQAKGVKGYLSKSLTGDQLVSALERIHAGDVVVEPDSDVGSTDVDVSGGDWPGRTHGLSARQAEIIALVTSGLTNDEIARRAYLSVNTVKSYLRLAYRLMGVSSRSQAILWGVAHGMHPDPPSSAAR